MFILHVIVKYISYCFNFSNFKTQNKMHINAFILAWERTNVHTNTDTCDVTKYRKTNKYI